MVTSIRDQDVWDLGGRSSILVRQKGDHVRLDGLLHRLAGVTGREQDAILAQVSRLVFTHAFAEETVLWPALRRALPDGEELTRQVESEHQEVNELMTSIEVDRPEGAERDRLLTRMIEVLRQDVRDEEDELLPRLQAAVDIQELRRLGLLWELVRRTAPTRPHPVVARRPPGNVVAAVPLSLLDRARDGVDYAARKGPSGVAATARRAERLLARGAHRVERLEVMRRGEHPSTRTGYGGGGTR